MSFIASVKPLLRSATDSITITLGRTAAGQLTATVVPRIAITEAQESDPAIATLKAALARPLLVELPDADPDTTFSAILTAVAPSRDAAEVALAEYLAAIEAAKTEAKAKADAKAKPAPKATPAKGAKPAAAAKPGTDSEDDEDDDADKADDGSAGTPAATTAPASTDAPPSAAPSAQPSLLADIF